MFQRSFQRSLGLTVLALPVLLCLVVSAQENRGRIAIRDFAFSSIMAPDFRATQVSGGRREYEWLQVMMEYESEGSDEWIDEVAVNWALFIQPKAGGRPIVLRSTVTYIDVPDGKHIAVVYVRPGFIRRYYGDKRISKNDIAVHVEVRVNGVAADKEDYTRGVRVPKSWWEVDDPRKAKISETELLPRTETPFAPLDYDSFEHIKPPAAR